MTLKNSLLLPLLFFLFSCNDKKSDAVTERERAITQRELEFEDKVADYEKLVKMRDSLLARTNKQVVSDTLVNKSWPDSLDAEWNSKMVCRESNCSNYVIGDQRNELWRFYSDSTGVSTKVFNNNKLIRVYRAVTKGDFIKMTFVTDSTSKNKVKIEVLIDDVNKKVIKGTQTITGRDNCNAKFSVELTPISKK
jgi:hypothetical protein